MCLALRTGNRGAGSVLFQSSPFCPSLAICVVTPLSDPQFPTSEKNRV